MVKFFRNKYAVNKNLNLVLPYLDEIKNLGSVIVKEDVLLFTVHVIVFSNSCLAPLF